MLPPEVQARLEAYAAAAPPLSPAQQDALRRIFAPHLPALARETQAA